MGRLLQKTSYSPLGIGVNQDGTSRFGCLPLPVRGVLKLRRCRRGDCCFRVVRKTCGAGGRTRTDMSLTSPDFESGAYTNFATPAAKNEAEDNKSSGSRIATVTRINF